MRFIQRSIRHTKGYLKNAVKDVVKLRFAMMYVGFRICWNHINKEFIGLIRNKSNYVWSELNLFYVYLIISKKNENFKTYVGYTTNIKKRLNKHNSNKGAKSTRGRIWKVIFKKNLKQKN